MQGYSRARLRRVVAGTRILAKAAGHSGALLTFVVPAMGTTSLLPTLTGTPGARVGAGSSYSFQPTAHDPLGRKLVFSIANKPAWASFSTTTGRIYGTPAATGTYPNITIKANDGLHSGALAAFTVTVTGKATVHWLPPTTNTNGTALTNFGGINIYYAKSATQAIHRVHLSASAPTSYTVGDLDPGTWYFSATAYNTAGVESALSPAAQKLIP
jgi:hypothetical protein